MNIEPSLVHRLKRRSRRSGRGRVLASSATPRMMRIELVERRERRVVGVVIGDLVPQRAQRLGGLGHAGANLVVDRDAEDPGRRLHRAGDPQLPRSLGRAFGERPPGGGGRWRSTSAGPAVTSSISAVSATSRVSQPATDSPCQCSGCGASETRPRWGFRPKRLHNAAGTRIDPPPSVPSAAGTMPGGDRRRRAAARAPGRAVEVPRVAGEPEGHRLGDAHRAERGHVRPPDHDPARVPDPADHLGVRVGRRPVGGGPVGRDVAGDVGVVLDRDRNTGERRRRFRAGLPLNGLRLVERLLVVDGAKRVELGIEPLDPPQAGFHQLPRGHLARAKGLGLAAHSRECERRARPSSGSLGARRRAVLLREPSRRSRRPSRGCRAGEPEPGARARALEAGERDQTMSVASSVPRSQASAHQSSASVAARRRPAWAAAKVSQIGPQRRKSSLGVGGGLVVAEDAQRRVGRQQGARCRARGRRRSCCGS